MVSLIPRLSSFAVSGTPAKTRVSDLSYVLKLSDRYLLASWCSQCKRFLRVDPSIYALKNWNRLIQPDYAAEFAAVFQKYTVRCVI
jgi:E3 ubiquitin-protein ligase SHPRH